MPTFSRLTSGLLRVGRRWPGSRLTGLLVLLLAAGLVIRRGLDGALAAMHLPGGVAAGASGVTRVEAVLDPGRVRAVLASWDEWSSEPGAERYVAPSSLLTGHAAVDLLLVAVPLALLLLRGLHAAHDRALRHQSRRTYPLRDATVTVTSTAMLPLATYLAAEVAENGLLLLAATGEHATWQLVLLGLAALLKWCGLALAGLAFILARLALGAAEGTTVATRLVDRFRLAVLTPVVVLRAQVLTVGALAGLLFLLQGDLGRQVQDVLLGLPEQPIHLLAAVIGAVGFAALTYATGRWSIRAYERPPSDPATDEALSGRLLGATGLAGAAVLVAGGLLLGRWEQPLGWALLPPGALLLAFAGLSAFPGVREAWSGTSGVPHSRATAGWLRALVALPLVAVGLVALQAAVTLGVAREFRYAAVLIGFALALMGFALAWWWWRSLWTMLESVPRSATTRLAFRVGVALVLVVAGWGAVDPWGVGGRLGSLGVLFGFLALLLVVTSSLVVLGDAWRARGALAFFRLRRVPVVSLVLVCFVATSYLDTSGRFHDVRLRPEPAAGYGEPVTVDGAYAAWVEQYRPAGEVAEKAQVPMLFVATGGGGIRAAYWTTTVLDCLFAQGQCERTLPPGSAGNVFAASGISGGSLGLAAFRATGDGVRPARGMLEDSDFVAPVIAALAFRDLPNSFLHADLGWLDRAGVLEVAWERAAAGRGPGLTEGFAQTSYDQSGELRFPLLLFNGAGVDDGCRVTASPLDAAPASADRPPLSCDSLAAFTGSTGATPELARTRDAFDYTCQDDRVARDLRLSTAALLSARFPYVSPSGGLTSCANPEQRTFVVDGGAIESSGAEPLTELWASLAPLVQQTNLDSDSGVCVEPRLVLIDNGYTDTRLEGLPRRPQELLVPVQAQAATLGKAAAAARQSAAIAFQATLGEAAVCRQPSGTTVTTAGGEAGAVAQLYPRAHPGPLAPLGWSLSSWARAELHSQLRENDGQLDRIRGWFGTG